MKIYSKFKDYYDCGMKYNSSGDDIVYVRETKQLTEEEVKNLQLKEHHNVLFQYVRSGYYSNKFKSFCWYEFFVGFCGKEYCGLVVDDFVNSNKCFYGEDLFDFVKKHNLFSIDRGYIIPKNCIEKNVYLDSPIYVINNYDIRSDFKKKDEKYSDIYLNPPLNALQFFKVMPPIQAFQELSMFISGPMAKQIDPKPLDDKYRLIAHGMDEWSFRNPDPPKRKQKCNKNKK